jgi:subtilisin family serine protease
MAFRFWFPLLAFAILAGCTPAVRPAAVSLPVTGRSPELVVRFLDETPDSVRVAVRQRYGAAGEREVLLGTEKWRLPDGADPRSVATQVALESGVKYAMPNHTRRLEGFTSSDLDTSTSQQWGLAKIRAPEAWDKYFSSGSPPGKGVTVAVLDSGVDVRHPDLAANAARDGAGKEIYIDVLRDASGSIDSCRGFNYDWVSAYQDIGHPGPDGHGHGTHVAGIIAAVGNNAGGSGGNIVGVAPAATILPVKTMDCNGDGQDWNIAYGIKAAADQGAKVMNLSIGGPEPSPLLEDALGYAIAKGALVVVAAGNGQGSPVYYPAAYPGVIAVGAVDRDDVYQSFSNIGSQMGLVAPGGTINQSRDGILSTVPTYRSELSQSGQAYSRVSGTSQASPFVAGVTALIWSREPSLTADQVRTRLYATARDIGPVGFDYKYGWGRVDAVAALAATDHRFVAP